MKKYIVLVSVLIIVSFVACNNSNKSQDKKSPVELITSNKSEVIEPSDLCFSYDKNALWTVSDETNSAYLISFEGKILKTIKLEGKDPEGITVIDDTTFAVVFERQRIFAKYSTSGKELLRKTFEEFTGELNAGFEGLTYNPTNGHFFIVNEKDPRLFIELDGDLNIIKKKELTFASDYSGVFYDSINDCLWLISDESKLIAKCDFDGNVLDSFNVSVPQMEGIAVDFNTKRIYAISDITWELFVYKIL